MFVQLLTVAVFAAAPTVHAAGVRHGNAQDRELQFPASLNCIIGGTDVFECCADSTDGVCTLLTCVDLNTLSVIDKCDCGMIEDACVGIAPMAAVVPQITGLCGSVDGCCEVGATANGEFNGCLAEEVAGGLEVPNFAALLPGGLPDLGLGPVAFNETTVATTTPAATTAPETTTAAGSTEATADTNVGSTEAPETTTAATTEAPVETTVATTEAPEETTVAPTDPAPEGADAAKSPESGASTRVVGTAMILLVSTLFA